MAIPAAGQSPALKVEAAVTVREDSFACKETSELDRLLQRNQRGEFTSGVQLADYLQSHKCIGLTAGRARVYANQGQYVCIYVRRIRTGPSSPAPGREEICCRSEQWSELVIRNAQTQDQRPGPDRYSRRRPNAHAAHDAWHEPGEACRRLRAHLSASSEIRKRALTEWAPERNFSRCPSA